MTRLLSRSLWRFFIDVRALGLCVYLSYWWVAPLFFRDFPVPLEHAPAGIVFVLLIPTFPLYALWDGGYDYLPILVAEFLHLPFPIALFVFYYLFSVGSVVTGDLVGGYFEADTSGIRIQWIVIGACFLFGGLLFFEPVVEAFVYTPTTPIVEIGVGLLALLAGSVLLVIDRAVARYRA